MIGDSWSVGLGLARARSARGPRGCPGACTSRASPGPASAPRPRRAAAVSFADRAPAAVRTAPTWSWSRAASTTGTARGAEVRTGFKRLIRALRADDVTRIVVVGPAAAPSRAAAVPRLDRLLCRVVGPARRQRTSRRADLDLPYLADQLHLTLAGHVAFGDAVAGRIAALRLSPGQLLLTRARPRAGYGSQAGGVTTAAVGWLRTANGSRPGRRGAARSRRSSTFARRRSMCAGTSAATSSSVVAHRLHERDVVQRAARQPPFRRRVRQPEALHATPRLLQLLGHEPVARRLHHQRVEARVGDLPRTRVAGLGRGHQARRPARTARPAPRATVRRPRARRRSGPGAQGGRRPPAPPRA